uniref:C2 domain-containing protein n=1 Tax=Guillardia theta TaxID=55529 RepID=A0A7S4V1J5_GUITH|mmetsp:Transcript_8765/g.29263  ORF Transcript_8765/g.29263 Transcript_8765/m.29263 type:complete len:647 (+) Transcript_8765:2-1942(+)
MHEPTIRNRQVDFCEMLSTSCERTLWGHYQTVTSLGQHENLLFSSSMDKTVRVWDMTTGECIRVIDLYFDEVVSCLAVGSGRYSLQLFTGSNYLHTFQIAEEMLQSNSTIPCLQKFNRHQGNITCLVHRRINPNIRHELAHGLVRLYTASSDRNIHVYDATFIGDKGADAEGPEPLGVLKGHNSSITALCVDDRRIFSGSMDTTVRIWDVFSFAALAMVDLQGNICNDLLSYGGRLYVATSDQSIIVMDHLQSKIITRLEGHSAYVTSLSSFTSVLVSQLHEVVQDENPSFESPRRAQSQLTMSEYRTGEECQRFCCVTISLLKARDLDVADVGMDGEGSSDPFAVVIVGGIVKVSGKLYKVEEKSARTRVMKQNRNPRWNETFFFILPEIRDIKSPTGSSVRNIPVRVEVWDWNGTGDDFMGSWHGVVGDLLPDYLTRACKISGADGTGPPDGADYGGWVPISPDALLVGRETPPAVGMRVKVSSEGQEWLKRRDNVDESKGGPGVITRVSQDKQACRVKWDTSIGRTRKGEQFPDGWECAVTYSAGKGGSYHLQVLDDKENDHGEVLMFCNTFIPVCGENFVLEPHRHFLASGSDDETIRLWDLYSHTCIAVIDTNHENKVSRLCFTSSGRLLSASQDSSIKLW